MKIIDKKLSELTPYANNPRLNDGAVDAVAASIKAFGFKVPCVIDKDGVIVAGHTRLKAAQKLGLKTVPCIVADDLTPEQIKAFRLADNKVGELAEWDFEKLDLELEELDFDMTPFGFGDEQEESSTSSNNEVEYHEELSLLIECDTEAQQEDLFHELTDRGFKCRVQSL